MRHPLFSAVLRKRLLAATLIGCQFAGLAGLIAVPAQASLRRDAQALGHSLGTAAHDVGHKAKTIGRVIGHDARHVAVTVGHAARAGGIEFWHALKGH